jgi:glycosyltransferase involved in cell wall biosynthesis
VLVHASRIEGGAHVIAEAVRSGTPVIASRIEGNVGMLGADYAGYFECNDAAGSRTCCSGRETTRYAASVGRAMPPS